MQAETLEKPLTNAPQELVARAVLPDEARLKREADGFLSMVESYIIDSPDTLQAAADDRNGIQDRWNALEKQRAFLKEPMLEGGRRIDNTFKPLLEILQSARKKLDVKIAAFTEQQKAEREAAERQAREKAELDARRQREAAAKAQAEADAKAAEIRKRAEEAAAAGRAGEAAKLQERAASTEAAGAQKAQDLTLAAEQTAAMPVPVSMPVTKASGIGMQYDYSAELTDKRALLEHILTKRPDLLTIVEIKESGLNAQARTSKEALDLPGVKLQKKPRISDKR